jgi:hypothetical protein
MLALHAHDADRAADVLREDINRGGSFLIERLRFPDDAERTTGMASLKPLPARAQAGRRG